MTRVKEDSAGSVVVFMGVSTGLSVLRSNIWVMRNSSCAFISSWVRRNSSTFRTRAFAQSGMSSGVPEVLVPARNSVPDLVVMALIPNDADANT